MRSRTVQWIIYLFGGHPPTEISSPRPAANAEPEPMLRLATLDGKTVAPAAHGGMAPDLSADVRRVAPRSSIRAI